MEHLTKGQRFLRHLGDAAKGSPTAGVHIAADALGLTSREVRKRALEEAWPSGWFKVFSHLAETYDLSLGIEDFNMREPASAPAETGRLAS